TISGITTLVGSTSTDDTLTGPDSATTWHVTGTNAGDINGQFFFSAIENLRGGDGSDEFVISTGASVGSIDGGLGTVSYSLSTGDGNDTVTLNNTNVIINGTTFALNGLTGITLQTGGGNDTITVDLGTGSGTFPSTVNI